MADQLKTFTVEADGTQHVIEGKPLTIVCHPGGVKTRVVDEDVREITPAMTLTMADKVAGTAGLWDTLRAHPNMQRLWSCVWKDAPMPVDLANAPTDMQHTVGLIVCTLDALADNMRPFWRQPETYLHPRQQVGVADLLITFTMMGEKK